MTFDNLMMISADCVTRWNQGKNQQFRDVTHFVGSVVLCHLLAQDEDALIALHLLVDCLVQSIANRQVCCGSELWSGREGTASDVSHDC